MKLTDVRRAFSRIVPASYAAIIPAMKFFIEPEVSCSRFFAEACFTSAALSARHADPDAPLERTELGDFLAKRLKDAIFVDSPCGLPSVREADRDWDLIPLVRSLGAAGCIEADLTADVMRGRVPRVVDVLQNGEYSLMNGLGDIGLREVDGFPVAALQDDLLGFVSKLQTGGRAPVCLYLSGLQPDAAFCADPEKQRTAVVPYLTALYDELARVCGEGDTLILNSAAMLTAGVDPRLFPESDATVALFQRGFTLKRRCPYGKVFVYGKD